MPFTRLLTLTCIAIVLSGCGSPEERAAKHLEKAQELFEQGDYVNANLEAQNTAQIEPKNADARYLLALIAEQDRKPRQMLNHLLVAVDEDPEMVRARVKLGTLYVFARAYDRAGEQAAAATALAPDDPDVLVLNARLLLQQGEDTAGLTALEEALAIDPDHVEAIGMLALTIQPNEPDKALGLLDDAIERLPRDESRPLRKLKLDILARLERTQDLEQALLAMIEDAPEDDSTYQARLASFYKNQGRMDEAEDVLRELATAASEDTSAKLDVVQFLTTTRTPETATEALQAFIEEDPENLELQLALGDLYLGNDRRDEALVAYREIAAAAPLSKSGLTARIKLATQRLQDGDPNGAGELLSGILIDAPNNPQALLMRAGLRFTEQRYDDAIADLRILLRKEVDNQRALLLMARSHIGADEIILGKDAYRRLLTLNPSHQAATRELIALMMRDNELEDAEALVEQIIQAGSGNIDAEVAMVELLMRKEDWPAAEAEARRLAAGDDPNGIGAFQLGQVLEALERYQDAAGAYSQALEKRPDSIPMMQGLARTLNAQGKQEEVLAFLRRSATENPDNPGIRMMLGGLLMDQGQTADALTVFESVITDQPTFAPAYTAMATLYPNDADKRIATYRRGLAALPAHLLLSALLADEYQDLGRIDDLIDLYEELLAAHPENQEVANNLASLLADNRYQDPASRTRGAELADSLADTDNPLIMDTVGWAYYRDGQYDRAVQYLQQAAAAIAENPVIRYHLGMAQLAAGDTAGAKRDLEQAIQLADADFAGIEEAREALASLE